MRKTPLTILGISPGTRSVGLAVMKAEELIEWRVKTFKGSWTHGKLKDILFVLTRYIEDHSVKVIALKKPDMQRSSSGLNQLVSELTVWAKMNRIKTLSFTLQEMKKHFSKEKPFSKAEMIRQVASKFPELFSEYNKEQKNKNPYYTKMIEAIALTLLQQDEVRIPFPL
jgi:Holliday junction resolvasome RuvABC endonuclease subunit